jgi:peptidoglycan/xylan/chitin deacetylase (PgdA/CDA1 family)
MNLRVKIAVASVLDKSGIISLVRNYRSTRGGLILSLHRVLPAIEAKESFEPRITITDTVFEQLLILLRREFHVVSLTQLLNRPEDTDGRQRVALTFDDGWSDTYSYAYPLLLRYEMPATVFLCPGLMEEGQMLPEERFARIWRWSVKQHHIKLLFQDLRKWGLAGGESQARSAWSRPLKRLAINAKLLMLNHLETTYGVPGCDKRRFLTWDEARIMRRSNITFGSHTVHHSTLTAEPDPSLEEELVNSREMIESKLQEEVRFLAYPNGSYDGHVMVAAHRAGYSHCFATDQGSFRRNANNYAIPRIHIDDSVVVNKISSLHASRVRFHLQHFVGPALLLGALTLRHVWCFQ